MHSPYTPQPFDALLVAQTSVALVLSAITWSRPSRPVLSSCVIVAAVWWAALLPMEVEFLSSFGAHLAPDHDAWALKAVATLAMVAAALSGRPVTILVGVVMKVALGHATDYFTESEWELAALHLACLGALVGLQARSGDRDVGWAEGTERSWLGRQQTRHDLVVFALATLLAAAVAVVVLEQSTDSSDEWAYTFQAAVFAKGRAYAPSPPCSPAYQNFWVFQWMGREFSQYTPGWPLFMALFALLGIPQFAAAPTLGLLVVAVARLARRASRESGHSSDAVAAAGTFAALSTTFASTLLINAGSRFGHVLSCALLAWAIEAICATEDACRTTTTSNSNRWPFVLGISVALLAATRPAEGAVSATGLALYGLYALARLRFSWRAAGAFVLSSAALGGLVLVILRLQLGVWFKTGYSLTPIIHSWGTVKLSWPKAGDWRWGIPLATGSYCWWPLSPALGAAGLVMFRGPAKRIAFMLAVGTLALFGFCSQLELGRGYDWGYGPRYVLIAVTSMAVGTGVALAPLWARTRMVFVPRRPLAAGPLTLAATAIALGVARLIPLVYPLNLASVRSLNTLNTEIRRQNIHHAVVFIPPGVGWPNDGLDLTMNPPLSLYPNPDVIIALDKTPSLNRCVREHNRGRAFYKALPGPRIEPAAAPPEGE